MVCITINIPRLCSGLVVFKAFKKILEFGKGSFLISAFFSEVQLLFHPALANALFGDGFSTVDTVKFV